MIVAITSPAAAHSVALANHAEELRRYHGFTTRGREVPGVILDALERAARAHRAACATDAQYREDLRTLTTRSVSRAA